MSRQLEYYYRNKEKINKKFAEKYRNNIDFRDAWKEKNKNEQKEHRKSTKILTELEEWLKEEIDDFKQDGYDNSEKRKDSLWLAGVYDQDKRILNKIQELKENE